MSMSDKIKPKIKKAIKKMPTDVTFSRKALNEFNEAIGAVEMFTTQGLSHQGNLTISSISKDSGTVKRSKQEFIMVLYDDDTKALLEGDIVAINGNKYSIVDLGNQNNMNIYLDILLGEVQ